MVDTNIRGRLAELMRATLADEHARHDWVYHAVRPMPVPGSWHPGQVVVGDCSKGVQYLCRWAGAPDPMGNNFASWGNSATICAHLMHLARPSQLQIGDVVTFGWWGGKHAAMVLEPGADPLLWSFGFQGSPNSYRLSQDGRVAQYLHLPVPPYQPSPGEKLRAETGYFAWVAWRLGEADWKRWGMRNPRVRPNVPTVIPPTWWIRFAQFLLNRGKGNAPSW